MTSTPSRASSSAISSFSCRFMETPGDCSPSRKRGVEDQDAVCRVALRVRVTHAVLLLYLAFRSSLLGMRLGGRHALFPPRGEEKKA